MHIRRMAGFFAVLTTLCLCACKEEIVMHVDYYPPVSSSTVSEESTSASADSTSSDSLGNEDSEMEITPNYYAVSKTESVGCEVVFAETEPLVVEGDSFAFTVRVIEPAYDPETLIVESNGETLIGMVAEDGYAYTVENVTEEICITARVSKFLYTVVFYPPESLLSTLQPVELTYEYGATIQDSDIPKFFGSDDEYACVWSIEDRIVTGNLEFDPTVYRKIGDLQSFLSLGEAECAILTRSIDFAGVDFTVDNEKYAVFEKYYGVLDGNGYALRNLTFKNGVRSLFGELSTGKLVNIQFESLRFEGKFLQGERRAFLCGVVGELTLGATIENCRFTAYFQATGDAERPNAVIVNRIINGSVRNCSVVLDTPRDSTDKEYIYAVCAFLPDSTAVYKVECTVYGRVLRYPNESF